MKLVVAIIQPETLEAVQAAVHESEACLVSISQAADGVVRTGSYRGGSITVPLPRLRLEVVVVNDMLLRETVEAIRTAGAANDTSRPGNGTIIVMELDNYVRIPNGPCNQCAG
jgi:nitrogen regulatory protein PII